MTREQAISTFNINISGNGSGFMLFAHGFGCDQNMWRFLVPDFEKEFKIGLFDLMGCGKSDVSRYRPDRYNSLEGHTDDLIQICDALGLKNITLVAHSVSAMIGAMACIRRPDLFDQIIMVCPSPCYLDDEGYKGGFTKNDIENLLEQMENNYLGWATSMAPVIMNNSGELVFEEELSASFCRNNPEIAKQFARVTFLSDNRKDISNIITRTLIIQCSEDIVAPPEVGQYMCKRIPDNELVVLDVIGHCPHLSAPSETSRVMRSFLFN
ncbi:MAG: alpha/beta fold hydrolase [Flavitalea sp.]